MRCSIDYVKKVQHGSSLRIEKMSTGWKFSVTLPSWTQATLEGDELVVVSLARQECFAVAVLIVSAEAHLLVQSFVVENFIPAPPCYQPW